MEAIIFCGIQATGKSTFFQQRFFATHVRISMDLLHTRHREALFLDACLTTQQPFVVDNTNPRKADRQPYIALAKANRFKIIGYYFQSALMAALARNNQRTGAALVPEIGVRGTYNKLELPDIEEGFDELYYVALENNSFIVQSWKREV